MSKKRRTDTGNLYSVPFIESSTIFPTYHANRAVDMFLTDGRRNIEDTAVLDDQNLEREDASPSYEYPPSSDNETADNEYEPNQFVGQQKYQIGAVYDSEPEPFAVLESGEISPDGNVSCNCAPVEDSVFPSWPEKSADLAVVLPCLMQSGSCQAANADTVLKMNDAPDEEFMDPYDRDYDALWRAACGEVDDSTIGSNVTSRPSDVAAIDVIEPPCPSWTEDTSNLPATSPISLLSFIAKDSGSSPLSGTVDLADCHGAQPIERSYEMDVNVFEYEDHEGCFASDTIDPITGGHRIPVITSNNADQLPSSSARNSGGISTDNFNAYYHNEDYLCESMNSSEDHPSIYNGSRKKRYTINGKVRSPLLYTPLLSSNHQKDSDKHADHKLCSNVYSSGPLLAVQSTSSHSLRKRSADSLLVWLRFVEDDEPQDLPSKMRRRNIDAPTRHGNRCAIILDSDILDGKLKPADLEQLMNRVSLEVVLHDRRFEVLLHRYVEEDMLYKRDDIAISFEEKYRVCKYLKLFSTFGQMNLMKRMKTHRCDSSKGSSTNDQISCLVYNLRQAKKVDSSTSLYYVTDLETCAIQKNRISRGVQFVHYGSLEDIFAQ